MTTFRQNLTFARRLPYVWNARMSRH